MSDLIIKGMEMPKDGCRDCIFVNRKWHGDVCPILKREVTGNVERGGFQTDCPLVPAADVRPVVRGKWSRVYDDFMKSNYDTCSCCGKEYFGAYGFNYCPNCGADMREGEK